MQIQAKVLLAIMNLLARERQQDKVPRGPTHPSFYYLGKKSQNLTFYDLEKRKD